MTKTFKIVGGGSFLVLLGQVALALAPEYVVPFCGLT